MKPLPANRRTTSKTKKIRTGDTVVAITGNYKGTTGKVLSTAGETAIVQGINIRKRHMKSSQTNPQGKIVEIERPIHVSNLMPCTSEGKAVKVKVRSNDAGEREFFYKDENGNDVLYRSLRKQ